MAKQINVGVGGVVKKVSKVPISIGGVVKQVKKGVCGVGGVVKEFFSGIITFSSTNGYYSNSFKNGCTTIHGSSDSAASFYAYSSDIGNKSVSMKLDIESYQGVGFYALTGTGYYDYSNIGQATAGDVTLTTTISGTFPSNTIGFWIQCNGTLNIHNLIIDGTDYRTIIFSNPQY